ncbi:MAG: type II toxin-antitoxin system VapC family toxin, partial [Streptosporangiaceae bacterium]
WLDALDSSEVGTTAITAAELWYGVTRLPAGRRRTELTEAVRGLLEDDFGQRVAPFDAVAAQVYGLVVTDREQSGRPIGVADAQIGAVCRGLGATLATRNTKDFEGTGVDLVNPWAAG